MTIETTPASPRQNRLLAALPKGEYVHLRQRLELVELPLGTALYESGEGLSHVYFPTDAIVSLLYVMEDGASAEIAVVGNDGHIGIALFMGGETVPNRALVQSAGYAYRLEGNELKRQFARIGGRRQGGRCTRCSSATRWRCSPRWDRPPSAIVTTRSTSNSAAGCCSAWIDCPRTSCT